MTMDRRISSLILGLMSVLILPSIPSNWVAVVFLLIGLILIKNHAAFACYIIGLSICILSINHHFKALKYIFPANSSIKGTIVSLPKQGNTHNSFKFELSSVSYQDQYIDIKGKLLLSWSGQHQLKQGQQWLFDVKSKPVSGLFNDGGFNYQRYLLSQGIIAKGTIQSGTALDISDDNRSKLSNALLSYINRLSHHRFMNALILGDKRAFTSNDWKVMRETGTSHLFAISGLHLSLIALFVGFLVQVFLKISAIIIPINTTLNERFLALTIVICCTFYSFLAGYSDPTLRALTMVIIFTIGLMVKQRFTFPYLIIFTLLIFGVLNPLSFLAQSFWLSLFAVSVVYVVITVSTPTIKEASLMSHIKNKIIFLIKLQAGLAVGLCVIQVWFFGGFSVTAPIANLVAVPVVTLLILPVLLTACCLMLVDAINMSAFLLSITNSLLDWLFKFLYWLSLLSWDWLIGEQVFYVLVIVIIIVIFITFNVFLPFMSNLMKCLFVIIYATVWGFGLVYGQKLVNDKDDWRIDFLDVGHGNSAIVSANNAVIIIDTGNIFGANSTIAETVITPFLQYHQLDNIDYIITTHEDSDHAGGLSYLIAKYPNARLINNYDGSCLSEDGLGKNIFQWQGLTIKTTQSLEVFKQSHKTENNLSCLVRIHNKLGSVLFTGDIEREAEKQLVNQLGFTPIVNNINTQKTNRDSWQSTVIQVPHHGSNTSSTKGFINLIQPEVGIVSTRAYNQWYFPRSVVLNRYSQQKTRIINTANSGQVTIEFSSNGKNIYTYRDHNWPFWYNRDLSFGHYQR